MTMVMAMAMTLSMTVPVPVATPRTGAPKRRKGEVRVKLEATRYQAHRAAKRHKDGFYAEANLMAYAPILQPVPRAELKRVMVVVPPLPER